MREQTPHSTDHSGFNGYLLIGVLVIMTVLMLLPSCQHDPVDPIDPDPMDTTNNPVDTTDIDPVENPCDPDIVYFSRDVLPILRSNCAKSGCHDAESHQDDIILDSYQNVMASGEVRPFNLNNSDLYEVITENDPDKRMPQPPNPRLTPDQINMIARWIQQGAKDLVCEEVGECNTENVSYSGFVVPLLTNYCVGCHTGSTPSGNVTLSSFSGVREVALNGRLFGAISWASGYQQMPRGSGQLPACTIDKIKAWIDEGAQNN